MAGKFPYIHSIHNFLPEKTYSNEDFFRDFPEEKGNATYARLGIELRHIMDPEKTATDYAVLAANEFFDKNKIDPKEIDFLLVNSYEYDHPLTPHNCTIIHKQLGMRNEAGALDLNYGCSAYVFGISVANALMQTYGIDSLLFITVNTLNRRIHARDKANRFLFGDAVSVTYFKTRETPGMGQTVFGADGGGQHKIAVPHGALRNPYTPESFIEHTDEYGNTYTPANYQMDGQGVFMFTVRTVPQLLAESLRKNNLTMDDIDLFVLHQTNHFLNDVLQKKCGIPDEKFIHHMKNTGNTVSSTIPIALQYAIEQGRVKKGSKVWVAGFGSGLSWAGTVITL